MNVVCYPSDVSSKKDITKFPYPIAVLGNELSI